MNSNWSVFGLGLWRQMGIHQSNLNRSMERLSSGLRINSAADDPAGLAISERMRAQIRGLNAAERNVQDGISMVQTADGALSTVQNILQRLNELATQSSNGTYNDKDRKALAEEFNQLLSEINTIGDQTEFNTNPLFKEKNGSGSNKFVLQIGANAGQTLEIDLGIMNTTVIGLKDVSIATQEDAMKAIKPIQNAIDQISMKRAKLGAVQNRLEYIADNLENYAENLTEAESRIRDADMAKEMLDYSRSNVLMQVTQSLFAQVNKQRQSMIDMLKSMLNS
ncbi:MULTISPECIES: flagellin [Clostridium]|uniref:Flagellin n=1 Tax=Clostridium cibarium TaxID=2762247 RepID=A0ABR8PX41_9CLOT|nr:MULTISPECIES: flagellin [Clostridium]MBD7912746.1 flagellin [Clostridium cibarium]